MALLERWMAELDELRARGRYRSLAMPRGADFTSNDYLGYSSFVICHLSFVPGPQSPNDQEQRTNDKWLSRSGMASRLLRGQHPIWEEVEAELAKWHGAESALVSSSGYLANLGLLSAVIGPDDWAASDEYNHASIIDGLRLSRAERFIYRHLDLEHLESGLRKARRRAGRECFIVTESLFSMEGDLAPLAELAGLAERYGAALIVDEAHSTGCFGPAGAGCIAEAGLRGRVLASVHTGGKALAVPGAYVCGSRLLREWLINRSRQLLFTTALPPAVGAWWLEAIERVRQDDDGRRALHANAALFRERLAEAGVPGVLGGHYIVPIVLGEDPRAVAAATALQEAGFDIRAIRPPTVPPGTARLRVSIHADHSSLVLSHLSFVICHLSLVPGHLSLVSGSSSTVSPSLGMTPVPSLRMTKDKGQRTKDKGQICVLGTDTDAGKTGFSALWMAAFGAEYEYWKPVESGDSDSERIRRLVPGAVAREPVVRFAEAVAPLLAARRAGRTVPSAENLANIPTPKPSRDREGAGQTLAAADPRSLTVAARGSQKALLIETFGSPLSPLNEKELQAELIRRWGCPTILVSAAAVGAVGRTLQCLLAIDGYGIAPAAVVLIGPPDSFAVEQIERHRRIRVFSIEPPASWTADGVAEAAERQRAVLAEIRGLVEQPCS